MPLVQQARVILADEPIASLDPASARRMMESLARINREDGTTVIVSLHQVEYALNFCHRIIALSQGEIVYDGPATDVTADLLTEIYGSDADDLNIAGLGDAMVPPPYTSPDLVSAPEPA